MASSPDQMMSAQPKRVCSIIWLLEDALCYGNRSKGKHSATHVAHG